MTPEYRPDECDQVVWHVVDPVAEDRAYRLVPP